MIPSDVAIPVIINYINLIYITNKNKKSFLKIKININNLDSINTISNSESIINLIDSILIRKLNLLINLIQTIIIDINTDFLNLKGICKDICIILKEVSNCYDGLITGCRITNV